MKKIKFLLFTVIALSLTSIIFSCKKDKESKPIIAVSPYATYYYLIVGDLITFKIDVTSEINLSRLVINSQIDNEAVIQLKDTAISSKGTSLYYYYKIPPSLSGKSIVFDFYVEDEKGKSAQSAKRVYVETLSAIQPKTLNETAGHRMYSNLSSNFDAYNLESNQGEFSIVADTASRDVQDFSGSDTTLSKNWKSPAGCKFVKFSGFNYATATDSSAVAAYNSGAKASVLFNLAVNDILITKLGSVSSNKYVVIRITSIVDAVGKNNDYYEFNIKK